VPRGLASPGRRAHWPIAWIRGTDPPATPAASGLAFVFAN